MPKVSVILTSYNKVKYLPDAINSVLAQTFKDFELIIVDDWSTDGSMGIINQCFSSIALNSDLPKEHDPLTCNRYTHNINLALKKATGEYITYLCDDDIFMPYRLEVMSRFLDLNPRVGVCYGKQMIAGMSDGKLTLGPTRNCPSIVPNAHGVIDHSSVMHRRECIEKTGGWDESLESWSEGDGFFWDRLRRAGYAFYLCGPHITDIHRYNEISINHEVNKTVINYNFENK
jgi:spore maturation protein CgeD